MKGDQTPPLTREQAWEANVAMAARNQGDAVIKAFLQSHEIKKFCIEKAVDSMKQSAVWFDDRNGVTRYYAEELARKFYEFLKEE